MKKCWLSIGLLFFVWSSKPKNWNNLLHFLNTHENTLRKLCFYHIILLWWETVILSLFVPTTHNDCVWREFVFSGSRLICDIYTNWGSLCLHVFRITQMGMPSIISEAVHCWLHAKLTMCYTMWFNLISTALFIVSHKGVCYCRLDTTPKGTTSCIPHWMVKLWKTQSSHVIEAEFLICHLLSCSKICSKHHVITAAPVHLWY